MDISNGRDFEIKIRKRFKKYEGSVMIIYRHTYT